MPDKAESEQNYTQYQPKSKSCTHPRRLGHFSSSKKCPTKQVKCFNCGSQRYFSCCRNKVKKDLADNGRYIESRTKITNVIQQSNDKG